MSHNNEERKTIQSFWDGTHKNAIRYRLPSTLHVGTANILNLLTPKIRAGSSILEIGFAPGKVLAYLATHSAAQVSGLDYSGNGVSVGKELFRHLGLKSDLRCEDLFESTFEERSFDFVFSLGFIEHFDNPTVVIKRHFEFLKPGGRALIAIPNYGGLYGKIQSRIDPENIAIHNMKLMYLDKLIKLTEGLEVSNVKAYSFGRVNPYLISLEKVFPRYIAKSMAGLINLAALVQPIDIVALSPLLVLEFSRK